MISISVTIMKNNDNYIGDNNANNNENNTDNNNSDKRIVSVNFPNKKKT